MNTIVEIAETIGTDSSGCGEAAENGRSTAVDRLLRRSEKRRSAWAEPLKVRKMREQAADLISNSLVLEEQTEKILS